MCRLHCWKSTAYETTDVLARHKREFTERRLFVPLDDREYFLTPTSAKLSFTEALITFPIRLQIVPRWTWKPVLAGGSPLAVVKVSHPKGVEDRSGDLIYKGNHIYKDDAAVSNFHDNSPRRGGNRDFRTRSSIVQSYKTGPLEHPAQCHSIDGAAVNGKTNNPSCELIHHHQNPISS